MYDYTNRILSLRMYVYMYVCMYVWGVDPVVLGGTGWVNPADSLALPKTLRLDRSQDERVWDR